MNWAVVCDFDGTITDENTGWDLLSAFALDGWQAIETDYRAGKFTGQQATTAQFGLVRGSLKEIERWAEQRAALARLRPGFSELLAWCHSQQIRVTVASGGVDVYVEPILRANEFVVHDLRCGRGTQVDLGMTVSFDHLLDPAYPDEADIKRLTVRQEQAAGRGVVFIGDSPNDFGAASQADLVFARASLATLCNERRVMHHPFEDFHQVLQVVSTLLPAAPADQRPLLRDS